MPLSQYSGEEVRIDPEHVAGIQFAGETRIVVGMDGSVERATTPAGESLMGGVPVPAWLGSGFLFWTSEALYRAPTFTGPLAPIAPVPTNEIGVEFGTNSILLFMHDVAPQAYALEPARPMPSSPHGVIDLVAADAERALAFDSAGRSLATVDGGRSWQDVTAALGEQAYGLFEATGEVAFVLRGGKDGAWLTKDGAWLRRPLPTTGGKSAAIEQAERHYGAISGLPFGTGRALTIDAEGIWSVELESGHATSVQSKVPYGSSCGPVSLESGGLFVCHSYTAQGSSTAVVSQALGTKPVVEKVFRGTAAVAIGKNALVVGASCAGNPTEGVACARALARGNPPAGAGAKPEGWSEINLQVALGTSWQVLEWVPKAKGGVAALVLERAAKGSPRLAVVDGASGTVTPFDLPYDHVAPHGFAPPATEHLVVLADGSLRGFTSNSSFSVDARGHVALGARTFENVASAGAFALARDDATRLWQTTDYGEHWTEVARPPFEPDRPAPAASNSHFPRLPKPMHCGVLGCVLEHESGFGSWLRLGWPADPPSSKELEETPKVAASAPAPPLALPPPRAPSARPKLRCVETLPPKRPGPPTLTQRGKAGMSIDYDDVFGLDTLVGYGRRAIVRVDTKQTERVRGFESLFATKAPLSAELVEPFDPMARRQMARGTLESWAPLLAHPAKQPSGNPFHFNPREGRARPVLSVEPGRTGGVLLASEDFSFWASPAGKIRPIRPSCRADAGYVDEHGTLFVACGAWSGATAIENVERGGTVLQLTPAARFRDESRKGMNFFAPGAPIFTNPDAIAVSADKRLAILRLGSGAEPPTVDDPAWLLSADAPPVELAPWTSLELATSPACAKGDGYRALIQAGGPWLDVDGAEFSGPSPGMSAIVRWSRERVCLEAIEIGLRPNTEAPLSPGPTPESAEAFPIMIVARFIGKDASSALLGTGRTASVRQPVKCELSPVNP